MNGKEPQKLPKFTNQPLSVKRGTYNLNKDVTYFFQKHIINGVDFEIENEDLIDEFKIEYIDKVPKIIVEKEITNKYILK